MMRDDFSRRWFLDVAACGEVQIRERGHPIREGLPVFSTDTREQAESIRILHCRLERDGSGTYRLNDRPANVDALDEVSTQFRITFARLVGQR